MSTMPPADLTQFATLVDLLRFRSEHQPDQIAFTFLADGENQEYHLTYRQLDERARAFAVWFAKYARAGDRVLLLYPAGLDLISAMFGCLYAGMIALPVIPPRPHQPLTTLQAIAQDAQARLALTNSAILNELKASLAQTPALNALNWLSTDHLPADIQSDTWQCPAISTDTLILLMYTSGSTSTPKGVMIAHRSLISDLPKVADRLNLRADKCMFSWAPLHHIAGLYWVFTALLPGTRFVFMPTMAFLDRPVRWLRGMTRYRAGYSVTFGFGLQLCQQISAAERQEIDLTNCDWIMVGGEHIRQDVLENFANTFAARGFRQNAFMPVYASTELAGFGSTIQAGSEYHTWKIKRTALEQNRIVLTDAGDSQGLTYVGCGWGLAAKSIMIVDPETRVPCQPNQVGEIWISGASVAQGYWNRLADTEQIFRAHLATGEGPFMRTGDLGVLMNGNNLIITGRLKELIIIRGKNFYAHDFEKSVDGCHPALQAGGSAAVAISVAGEESLAIVVEVKTNDPNLKSEEVVRAVRQAVAKHQGQPVHLVGLIQAGTLPRTASGKLRRFLVRQLVESGEMQMIYQNRLEDKPNPASSIRPGYVAPRTAIERALVGIWSGVLNLEQIGVEDNFFELGGDSIKATQILAQTQDVFQIQLDMRLPFDLPTIANMAEMIVQARQSQHELKRQDS